MIFVEREGHILIIQRQGLVLGNFAMLDRPCLVLGLDKDIGLGGMRSNDSIVSVPDLQGEGILTNGALD